MALVPISNTISTEPERYVPGTTTPLTSGPVGTLVQVTGTIGSGAATPFSTVTVYWDSLGGTVLGTFDTGADGSYQIVITIPSATAGPHNIVVYDMDGARGATFDITPRLDCDLENALPGYSIYLTGTGFGASSLINITFQSTTVYPDVYFAVTTPTVFTTSDGSFAVNVIIPSLTEAQFDAYVIHAYGVPSLEATVDITLDYYVTVTPESGPAGTLVTVQGEISSSASGFDFLFNYVTQFTWSEPFFDGTFSFVYTISDTLSPNIYPLQVYWAPTNTRTTYFTVTPMIIRSVPEFIVVPNPIGYHQGTWFSFEISPAPPFGESYTDIRYEMIWPNGTNSYLGPFTTYPGTGVLSQPDDCIFTPNEVGDFSVRVFSDSVQEIGGVEYSAFSSGFVDFVSQTQDVTYPWPTPAFSHSPVEPCAGQDVHFDASSSYDLDGSIVGYTWWVEITPGGTFDHMTIPQSADPTFTHVFNSDGIYLVYLFVVDDDDWIISTSQQVTVRDPVYHDLTLSIQGSGNTNRPLGVTTFFENDEITVTSYPDSGWALDHWLLDGSLAGSDESFSVLMDTDHSLVAVFTEEPVELTIINEGSAGITSPMEGVHTYAMGTDVDVLFVSIPDGAWVFDHWLLDDGSTVESYSVTVTMDADHVLTAVSHRHYAFLKIITEGEGTTFPAASIEAYRLNLGIQVDVSATPSSENWVFNRWELDGVPVGNDDMYTFTLDDNHELTAVFVPVTPIQYDLTIEVDGLGSTNPPAGTHSYSEGNMVLVTASTDSVGWSFNHWLLDNVNVGSSAQYGLQIDGNHVLRAVFTNIPTPQQFYTLTLEIEGSGSTFPSAAIYQFMEGEAVVIESIPESGWNLSYWLLDNVNAGSSNSFSVLMDSNHVLRAVFIDVELPQQYHLTVDAVGSGSTDPQIGVHSYNAGSSVTVTAYPPDGWTLDCWMLDGQNVGKDQTITCSINADSSLTAVFTELPPLIPPILIPPIVGGGAVGAGVVAYKIIKRDNGGKERKKPKKTWLKLSLLECPKSVVGDMTYTVKLKISNVGPKEAKNVRVFVYSTTELKMEKIAERISSIPIRESAEIVFKFKTSKLLRRGTHKLRFVAKARNCITTICKDVTFQSHKIGLLVDPKNKQTLTHIKNWLKTQSLTWDELHSADNVLKLLSYDLIIVSLKLKISPKWAWVLRVYVDNGGALLKTKGNKTIESEITKKMGSMFKI